MTDPSVLPVLAMAGIGLLGAGHCVGMCGGIATGLGLASGDRATPLVLGYNLGRVLSYSVAGVIVAALGYWGREYLALGPVLRILAAVILILMGLYLADWWRALVYLERLGTRLWRWIQPLGRGLLPVRTFPRALMLGMVWGWLPCGLVYSALAYAATASSPWQGGMMMAAFGLGTAPAMVAGGLFSSRLRLLLQGKGLRRAMAVLMILFGVWTLASVVSHSGRHGGGSPGSHSQGGQIPGGHRSGEYIPSEFIPGEEREVPMPQSQGPPHHDH